MTVAPVRSRTPAGRWVLAAAVLGSGMAALDATVINVALPTIGRDLDADVTGLQWIVSGYLLTLASFLLLGGSLGDLFGRRRVFELGIVWFAGASLLCGLAPSVPVLVAARALQGVGGALLTPGSLALIQASFHRDDRAKAIGAWSGLGGVATAVGPFAGGWLVEAASWRWIFLLNLPMAALTLAASRHVPESSDADMVRGIDVAGAVTAALGLAGVTWALTDRDGGATSLAIGLAGLATLGLFLGIEARSPHPMMPLDLFASRVFSATNGVTFALYGALGGAFFLFAVELQASLGYSPVEAGAALFPLTVIMLVLSSRSGALGQRTGPRLPMTLGPVLAGAGLLGLALVGPGDTYLTGVLPAMVLFGLGLVLTVPTLTATALASVADRHAGIASGINNTVARTAGLLAVAALPGLAGIHAGDDADPASFADGAQRALVMTAVLAAASGLLALITLHPPCPPERAPCLERSCALDGPPLRSGSPAVS